MMLPLTPSAPDLNNLKICLTDWFQCLRGCIFGVFVCVLCGGRGMGGGFQSFDTLGPIICRLLVGRWGSSSFIFVSDICKVPDNKMSPPVVCGDASVNESSCLPHVIRQ